MRLAKDEIMNISENNKKIIADEFRVVANLMDKENDGLRKVFYFSGAYGVVQRMLNLEYSNELALLHGVLNNTYQALNNRLVSLISGAERVVAVPASNFDVLSSVLKELGDALLGDKDILEYLGTISAIAYMTTGNGYYLYSKGVIKLE